jgi:hypothetical protein
MLSVDRASKPRRCLNSPPAPGSNLDAFPHAVLDRGVVADVEVQVTERAEGPPVAPVERIALLHVECAGDDLPALAREHQADAIATTLEDTGEERAAEIALAPRVAVDRSPVQPETIIPFGLCVPLTSIAMPRSMACGARDELARRFVFSAATYSSKLRHPGFVHRYW